MTSLGLRWPPSWACTSGADCKSQAVDAEELPGSNDDEAAGPPVSRTRRARDSSCCGAGEACLGDDEHEDDFIVRPQKAPADHADTETPAPPPDGVGFRRAPGSRFSSCPVECCVRREGEQRPSPELAGEAPTTPRACQDMRSASPAGESGGAAPQPLQTLGLHQSPLHAIEECDDPFEVDSDDFAENPSPEEVEAPCSVAQHPSPPSAATRCGPGGALPGEPDDDRGGDAATPGSLSVHAVSGGAAAPPPECPGRPCDASPDARAPLPEGAPLGGQAAEPCGGRRGELCPSFEHTIRDGPLQSVTPAKADVKKPCAMLARENVATEEHDDPLQEGSDEAPEKFRKAATWCEGDVAESPRQGDPQPEGATRATAAGLRKAGAPSEGARRRQGWPADMPDPSLWSFVSKRQVFQDGGEPNASPNASPPESARQAGDGANADPRAAGDASEEKSSSRKLVSAAEFQGDTKQAVVEAF